MQIVYKIRFAIAFYRCISVMDLSFFLLVLFPHCILFLFFWNVSFQFVCFTIQQKWRCLMALPTYVVSLSFSSS